VSEGLLFAIGSVVFILVSAAILWYGYARFNEVYERDQSEVGGPVADQAAAMDQADGTT
jgi:hypothetical protein